MVDAYTNHHHHSRFVLLDRPRAYPHMDMVDGITDAPVFDLGVDVDARNAYGVAYIKVDHIIEMAQVLGMATTEQQQEQKDYIEMLEARIDRLPKEANQLADDLANLVSHFHSRISDPEFLASGEQGAEAGNSETDAVSGHSGEYPAGNLSGSSEELREGTGNGEADSGNESGVSESKSEGSKRASGQKPRNAGNKGPDKLSAGSGNGIDFGFGSVGPA